MSKKDVIIYAGFLGPLVLSLLAFVIVDFFDLFTPSYLDIAIINNINEFSDYEDFVSFLWTSHLILSPFVFLYFMIFLPVDIESPKTFSFSGFIIPLIAVILFYMILISLPASSEDMQDVFDDLIMLYLIFLLPLTAIPCFAAFGFKTFSKLQFLYRT